MYPGTAVSAPDTLKVLCTESLSDLMGSIQDEYKLLNPGSNLNVGFIGKDVESAQLDAGGLLLTLILLMDFQIRVNGL